MTLFTMGVHIFLTAFNSDSTLKFRILDKILFLFAVAMQDTLILILIIMKHKFD